MTVSYLLVLFYHAFHGGGCCESFDATGRFAPFIVGNNSQYCTPVPANNAVAEESRGVNAAGSRNLQDSWPRNGGFSLVRRMFAATLEAAPCGSRRSLV